ncbi:MAG TPA: lipopolysaccharide biosynthesis protein [Xanthobacteraceae bacterium]|nr:lipopolysaccharide biosynthesis protein [Xanthobacteraceae bacterium]
MHALFHTSTDRLKQRAQRASILNLVARGIDFFFQFVSLMLLARLLTPADYGVFAMAAPFVWTLINIGDLGLAAAVLQQPDLNERQAAAVFQVNALAGIAFAAILFLSSPIIGWFYGDARVAEIVAILSFMLVVFGFTTVQQTLLRRALLFDVLLRAQIASSATASIVALVLAWNGAGYWALVARALVDPLVSSIVAWASAPWWPRDAEWSEATKKVLRFGQYFLASSILSSAARQADNVLIGWRYGSAELGPYALAYRLFFLPIQQIAWPLGHVMVPTLSRLRDDPERLKRWYLKLLQLMSFAAFPPFFSLVICADDVVRVVAGPQWDEAVEIVRLLAPLGALMTAYSTCDWLLRARGYADRSFWLTVVNTVVCVSSYVVGLPWGAIGVASGLAVANIILFLPGFIYATRGTTIRLTDSLQAMLPSLGVTFVAVLATWLLRVYVADTWIPIVRLLATGAVIGTIMGCGWLVLYGHSRLTTLLSSS